MSTLEQLLGLLQSQAKARPDLGEQEPVATYLGRPLKPGMGLQDIMAQLPQGDAEEGARAGLSLAAGGGAASAARRGLSKVSAPTLSNVIALAPKGAVPITPTHQMWPALIEDISGKVHSAGKPWGSGGIGQHDILATKVPKGVNATRGFVDPVSFNAFTEAVMEEIERSGRGFGLR